MLKSFTKLISLFRDTFILPKLSPGIAKKIIGRYDYAFLIHPRDYSDYLRQFPIAKILPKRLFKILISRLGPIVVSKITGLRDRHGDSKTGLLISILTTPDILLSNKNLALRKIQQATDLSEKLGAKVIGLGALTASVTSRGKILINREGSIGVTTGHGLTTLVVVRNMLRILSKIGEDVSLAKIAVVGAAGSIGNACTRLLIKKGARKFILIDKKIDLLREQVKHFPDHVNCKVTDNTQEVKGVRLIITATNAPYAVITSDMVVPGTIILDDAQPSDLDSSLQQRDDIITVEAGICRLPGINPHFNFGLLFIDDIFGCLGETMIHAWNNWEGHYVIDYVRDEQLQELENLFDRIGFRYSEIRGLGRVYSDDDLLRIKRIRKRNK
jgi:predicted amino acid dehydrogenase